MRKAAFAVLLLTSFAFHTLAQGSLPTDSAKYYQRLDVSYVFGGQIYNNNFIYNPGFSFQTAYGKKLNESVTAGLGIGYTFLKDEHFLPIFLEVSGIRKNKRTSPMIIMQAGYAHGWYSGDIQNNYKFRGGAYIGAGMGRKIAINKDYSILFHWSYRHQFARIQYNVFGDQKYTEGLNFDMLVISLGIIRN